MPVAMPKGIEFWTCDEVAECLDYEKFLPPYYVGSLYVKLWGFLEKSQNPTPLGGDGTDGTVEYPDARRSVGNDDKATFWWPLLKEVEQLAIVQAFDKR